jgi:2,4-dienoyl-CoA reductase (NADPH2)
MVVDKKFETLFTPFKIRGIELKNRMVKSPQGTYTSTHDGAPSEDFYPYLEALAKGGVGLIIVEATVVDAPLGLPIFPWRILTEDKFIPYYARMAELVHQYGTKIILQLFHAGPSHPQAFSKLQPVSASSIPPAESPSPLFNQARELTIPEIKDIEAKFVQAAGRIKNAGLDGVEFHGGHRYLINAFLSPGYNRRQDEYGNGTLENRARMAVDILKETKQKFGSEDFIIGIRMNGQEWGLKKGISQTDSNGFAKLFQAAGADYLHVSGYGYHDFLWSYWPEQLNFPEPTEEVKPWLKTVKKPGFIVLSAEQIKKQVEIPVIGGGRIQPDVADTDIKENKMDLYFIGRRLFADPELPNKLAAGKVEDIAPCTACRECWDAISHLQKVQCRINTTLLNETENAIKPAVRKKKVLIIGSGPAGMEAARVAALRGHDVTIYERESRLGGQLNLAAMIKGLDVENLDDFIDYFKVQFSKLGIKIKLGKTADSSVIAEERPDVVVVATGGKSVTPLIPGIDKKIVLKSSALYEQSRSFLNLLGSQNLRRITRSWMPVGKTVVVMGGDIQGLELAEFLVKRGRKVTVVEEGDKFGVNLVAITAGQLIPWLTQKGVTMISGAKFKEVTDDGLVVTGKDGELMTLPADNILTALPLAPDITALDLFKGKAPEVYAAGDCREPRRVLHAVHDGARVGRLI